MWELGTKLHSSARAVNTLRLSAVSPDPQGCTEKQTKGHFISGCCSGTDLVRGLKLSHALEESKL